MATYSVLSQAGAGISSGTFFQPGATFVEETVGSGSGGQAVATTYPAYEYLHPDQPQSAVRR